MYPFSYPSHYTPQPLYRGGYSSGYPVSPALDRDYLVAQEEAAIRRRLADIESQRQQAYYQPSFGYNLSSYEPEGTLNSGVDRLAALRREVELEEQRYAAAARRQEEKALEAKLEAARQRRQALEGREKLRPVPHLVLSVDEPIHKEAFVPQRTCARLNEGPKRELGCPRGHCQRGQAYKHTSNQTPSQPPFLDFLSSIGVGEAAPSQRTSAEPSFEDIIGQILQVGSALAGQTQEESSTKQAQTKQSFTKQPEMPPIQEFLTQMFKPTGAPSQKQTEAPKPAASPEAKASEKKEAPQPQDFLSQLLKFGLGAANQEKAPQVPQVNEFLSQMLELGKAFSGGVPQQQQSPSAAAGPSNSTRTLKEELEARLYGDESTEVKDTVQAILASLADPSTQSVGNIPVPPRASSPTPSSSSSSEGKGKAKEESKPVSPTDTSSAINTMNNIAAAFSSLESEFAFPTALDFATPSGTPASSDSEGSSISRLAYTSRNQPVRYYEQSLSGLISQLDEIDTSGNEELRTRRRELVSRIEKASDELDEEVEGRWKSKQRKEQREREEREKEQKEIAEAIEASAREAAAAQASETDGSESLAASETTVRPYDAEDAEPTVLDSFLLTSETPSADNKKSAKKDSDSDWSEVDA